MIFKKEKYKACHMADSGCATCHADVSTGSADADVIMVKDDVSVD